MDTTNHLHDAGHGPQYGILASGSRRRLRRLVVSEYPARAHKPVFHPYRRWTVGHPPRTQITIPHS
jgi:hypothetical protein